MKINAEAQTVTIPLQDLAVVQCQLDKLQRIAQGIYKEHRVDPILTDFDIQMDALSSIRETLNLTKGPMKVK